MNPEDVNDIIKNLNVNVSFSRRALVQIFGVSLIANGVTLAIMAYTMKKANDKEELKEKHNVK